MVVITKHLNITKPVYKQFVKVLLSFRQEQLGTFVCISYISSNRCFEGTSIQPIGFIWCASLNLCMWCAFGIKRLFISIINLTKSERSENLPFTKLFSNRILLPDFHLISKEEMLGFRRSVWRIGVRLSFLGFVPNTSKNAASKQASPTCVNALRF